MSKQAYRESQRCKPIGKAGIEQCRVILREGYAKVNECMVDSYTAGAIIAIYDKINEASRSKLEALPIARVADICFQLLNKRAA